MSLASLAYGQSKSKGPARRPMNFEDASKGGSIAGFGDKPMAFPASEMGKGPTPGFMDKGEIGKGAEDTNRLEAVKLRISEINDIASTKVSLSPDRREHIYVMLGWVTLMLVTDVGDQMCW